jgi:hypothetical protein
MKSTITILLIIFSTFCYSQKSLDAQIITFNNDTINSRIRIQTNLFNKKLIDENSFYRRITIVDDTEAKISNIDASEVKELKFMDLNGTNKTYVNNGKLLMELIYNGKRIKWYYEIRSNAYDGSISLSEYLIDENGKEYRLQFIRGFKRVLLEVIKSKPELVAEIKNTKITKDIMIAYLERYENEE